MSKKEQQVLDGAAEQLQPRPKKGRPRHKDGELPVDMRCGFGPCSPAAVQCCARMGVFVGAYSICGLMTSVLSMYIMSQITTIEKQFGLSSSQSGLLLSCNDIGYLLTTLLASYFARKVHIPRVLWLTVIVYGVAGIICSLAYFVSKDFIVKQGAQISSLFTAGNSSGGNNASLTLVIPSRQYPMCNKVSDASSTGYAVVVTNSSKCDMDGAETSFGVGEPNQFTNIAMTLIAIGMVLQGLAKAPRYPFLTTYVDDNVNKKNTAMYMGIISGVAIFGPAIAFSVGSVFSRQYVTLQDVPISPRHPAWIGAWWLGFLVFGIISIFVSFPLLFFPRKLRPRPPKAKQPKTDSSVKQALLGFLKSLFRLVSNSVYMPLTLSTCVILFGVAGMIAFSAKYLETQFFIPAWKANMLVGLMNIVAASIGTVVGGCVVTKRKLSPLACIRMLLVVGILSVVQICLGYVFGCPNPDIVGFNQESPLDISNASCATGCGCDPHTYFPVCGNDDVNYMTPCHAGCTKQENLTFAGCSCGGGRVSPGLCETSCDMLYPYLINNVFGAFLGTLGMMPGFIVMLRSVSEADKSMAVGFSSLLSTLCGWFAGPVVFGIVIDSACRIWSASCSGQGACALYDNIDIRVKMHSYQLVPKVLAVLLQVIVYWRARHKTDWSLRHEDEEDNTDSDTEDAMKGDPEAEMDTYPSKWRPDPIY
ncbi:SO2A1-like protein [Mya arenaria]|uniref:Solute carrier organic anion transporter family member n=1 Tax=Mya arenaria TaxID=6604 RepID=A0ABY7E0E3_MYAAR|nr:solute carrier organic anion transporter family member 2A1-like isoform X2 [Mya arenaria]WAR03470.1 SO2A1-like protein [Mya arenaria]